MNLSLNLALYLFDLFSEFRSLFLRDCYRIKASSLFGIILAAFRFKLQGSYTQLILPLKFEVEKQLKRTQKIDRSLIRQQSPSHVFFTLPSKKRSKFVQKSLKIYKNAKH